ncbi:MAG: aldo/keto reductase [Spirochaetes bacterium]|nr:aldo/keto reductase [Spirochaetota bacterium]
MERIRFGRTDLTVSRVAMGGIPIMRLSKPEAVRLVRGVLDLGVNFIDTATGYTDSEEKIGEAIRGVPRDNVVLASKSPADDRKTFLQHLDLSLKRLGVEYIDLYQLHNVSTRKRWDAVFAVDGAFEGLMEAVRAGKVRYPGFSSHSVPLAIELMKTGHFSSVQLPFNCIDTEAESVAVPLAKEIGMGFIAMKPVGGGMLDNASLAIRYILQYDHIVPDPGIERIEEMEEIVNLVNRPTPLSEEEIKQLDTLRKELGAEWCHRCDYCQPCPEGIHISSVLSVKSFLKRMPLERAYQFLNESMRKVSSCTECRTCVSRCPYELSIPELLKKNVQIWDKAIENLNPSMKG